MYADGFEGHLYNESPISRFEVITTTIYKCIEYRPFQYKENLNFITGKASEDFIDVHVTIPNTAPSVTLYTKRSFEMIMLYHKNHRSIKYRKVTNFFALKFLWRSTSKCTS